jgi:SPP1 gp7 family putative phage head morphogenesis protein
VTKRLAIVKRHIIAEVEILDGFGLKSRNPTANAANVQNAGQFQFASTAAQVDAFEKFIQQELGILASASNDAYWEAYVAAGYEKGAGRAFSEVRVAQRAEAIGSDTKMAHYLGTREEFLASSFGAAESVDKVKLLAARTFTDLKNVETATAAQIRRVLTDGLVQGQNPATIARTLTKTVDTIGKNRATVIARTEIIRAHAEGQLDGFERLGIAEVGAMAEWRTAGDDRVCPICGPLEGEIMKIADARGQIPRHPQCRCSWSAHWPEKGLKKAPRTPRTPPSRRRPTGRGRGPTVRKGRVPTPTPDLGALKKAGKLTPGEQIAVDYYASLPTGQGTGRMQGLLNGSILPQSAMEKQFVASFRDAVEKMPETIRTAYRGLAVDDLAAFAEGKFIEGQAIEGWTLSQELAKNYASVTKGAFPERAHTVVLKVKNKFRDPSAFLKNASGKDVLRLRSAGYIVDKVEDVNGVRVVTLRKATAAEKKAAKGLGKKAPTKPKVTSQPPPTPEPAPTPPKGAPPSPREAKEALKDRYGFQVHHEKSLTEGTTHLVLESLDDMAARYELLEAYSAEKQAHILVFKPKGTFTSNRGNEVYGTYNHSEKTLKLAKLRTKSAKAPKYGDWNVGADLRTTFRHEYGHQVWYNGLTTEQKALWMNKTDQYIASSKQKLMPASKSKFPVSQYARTNSKELWSESFAAYTHPGYKPGSLPRDIEDLLEKFLKPKQKLGLKPPTPKTTPEPKTTPKPKPKAKTRSRKASGGAGNPVMPQPEEVEELRNKLLSLSRDSRKVIGGQIDNDPDVLALLERGELQKGTSKKMVHMTDGECHWNIAELYGKDDIDDIVLGYARGPDGDWHQHTWGLKNGKIIETTQGNATATEYYGMKLTKTEAKAFANHAKANPPGGGVVRRTTKPSATLKKSGVTIDPPTPKPKPIPKTTGKPKATPEWVQSQLDSRDTILAAKRNMTLDRFVKELPHEIKAGEDPKKALIRWKKRMGKSAKQIEKTIVETTGKPLPAPPKAPPKVKPPTTPKPKPESRPTTVTKQKPVKPSWVEADPAEVEAKLKLGRLYGSEPAMRGEAASILDDLVKRHPDLEGRIQRVHLDSIKVETDRVLRGGAGGRYTEYGTEKYINVSGHKSWARATNVPDIGPKAYSVDESVSGFLRHELGHAIMPKGKVPLQKWEAATKGIKTKISKYGASNSHELFAEAFSAYTHPGYVRGTLPKTIEKYFDDFLKPGAKPKTVAKAVPKPAADTRAQQFMSREELKRSGYRSPSKDAKKALKELAEDEKKYAKLSEDVSDKLLPKERETVKQYSKVGDKFINASKRGQVPPYEVLDGHPSFCRNIAKQMNYKLDAATQKAIREGKISDVPAFRSMVDRWAKTAGDELDTLIARHGVEPTRPISRGMALKDKGFKKWLQEYEEMAASGKTFDSYGFMSTTYDKDIVLGWSNVGGEHPVIFEISAKKALPIEYVSYFDEAELLLSSKAKYKVHKVLKNVAYDGQDETYTVIQLLEV